MARLDRLRVDEIDRLQTETRNYIIEKKTMRIVEEIPRFTKKCRFLGDDRVYKNGGTDYDGIENLIGGKNHSSTHTIWNPTEQTFLIIHNGKWWYNALYFCERFRSGFRIVEIGDSIETFVRRKVQKLHPRVFAQDYATDQHDPFVSLIRRDERVFYPGKLVLNVECDSVMRAKTGDEALYTKGIVELRVTSSWQRLNAIPVRFTSA